MRSRSIAFSAALLLPALPALAGYVEGSFAFDAPSFDGATVSGTFGFDTSDPTEYTLFTLDWPFTADNLNFYNNTNPYIAGFIVDALPGFRTGDFGTGFYGAFDVTVLIDAGPTLLSVVLEGTFLGTTGTMVANQDDLFQSDFVQGTVVYTSPIPAPGAAAVLCLAGLLSSTRKRA